MCGICGYINYKDNFIGKEKEHMPLLRKMTETLKSRGPDAEGFWIGENAAFGHRRLAVIDVERGKQPMKRTVCGHEFVIAYNGELYNTCLLYTSRCV